MPIDSASGINVNPTRACSWRSVIAQRRWPSCSAMAFGNRCTGSRRTSSPSTIPATTRPPDAPMSTAAKTGIRPLPEERGAHATVDGDEETGRATELVAGERGDRLGDVLGQDLPLQEGPLRIERAQLALGDAVHGRPVGTPSAGEDAAALDDAVGVHAVHPDAVRPQLDREQADLVG